jgi:acetylornithine/succinyldiaminopimelate/putrescine aminotransferase
MEGRFDALEKQISQLIHAVDDLTAQVQSLAYVSRKDPTKMRAQQFVESCPVTNGKSTHIFCLNSGGDTVECKLCKIELNKYC